MRIRRVIEYEGSEADVAKVLERALLTAQREIRPGDRVPRVGFIHAGLGAPQVVIRLISEETIP